MSISHQVKRNATTSVLNIMASNYQSELWEWVVSFTSVLETEVKLTSVLEIEAKVFYPTSPPTPHHLIIPTPPPPPIVLNPPIVLILQ